MRKSLNHLLRKSRLLLLFCPLAALLTGCSVHEFPEPEDRAPICLQLNYSTELLRWEHEAAASSAVAGTSGATLANDSTRSIVNYGHMRYIVRAYQSTRKGKTADRLIREFEFTRNVADGYDCNFLLDLPTGDYTFRIWSDLVEFTGMPAFYNAQDFLEIKLTGKHCGNNDYRDAFRGFGDITVKSYTYQREPDTLKIEMKRPLAKFEFVTTDLKEFIEKQVKDATIKGEHAGNSAAESAAIKNFNINDYRVEFYYNGYMPSSYNIFTDKPNDASMGVHFDSKIARFNNREASLGFDYVFVNGAQASVSIQIAIFSKENERVSLTSPINVPLRRDRHTIMRGSFLMQNSRGDIAINPDFENDYNIFV